MTGRFVEGAWDCPNCMTGNTGHLKNCRSCGAPQPPGVEFYVPKGPLVYVTAPERLAEATAGPDVHCPYCGTRNANGAKTCSLCGGDLRGGHVRSVGDNPATEEDEGVSQPDYAQGFSFEPEPEDASVSFGPTPSDDPDPAGFVPYDPPAAPFHVFSDDRPDRSVEFPMPSRQTLEYIGWGVLIAVVLALVSFLFWNTFINVKPESVRIESLSWYLEVPVGVIRTFHETNQDSTESGAYNIRSREVNTGRYEQKTVQVDVPVTRADESHCGTKLENKGNGYFEQVAKTCTFDEKQDKQVDDLSRPIKKTVYDYDVDRWVHTRSVTASGNDTNPVWPTVILGFGESEGTRKQIFTVYYIDAQGEHHIDTTSNRNWFVQRRANEVCLANRNGWGALNSGLTCPAP